jgi:hypothetical protein
MPDESPAPGTSDLEFVTDLDLRASLRNDIGAVSRALSNGEWKAATVLAGSTAEALLLWTLNQLALRPASPQSRPRKASGLQRSNPKPTLGEWNLHEYIEVAAELGVIKANTPRKKLSKLYPSRRRSTPQRKMPPRNRSLRRRHGAHRP